jgi:hypothetical protein
MMRYFRIHRRGRRYLRSGFVEGSFERTQSFIGAVTFAGC